MSSTSPEHRPEETTPLLGSTSNDAAGGTRSPANQDNGDNVAEASPSSSHYKLLFPGFAIALGAGIAELAFLFGELVLAEYGKSNFDYGDWHMSDFEGLMFWTGTLSTVYNAGNFICLWRTRKPFNSVINTIVIGLSAYVVVGSVAMLMAGYSPGYCRYADRPDPGDGYLGDDNRVDLLPQTFGPVEDCQKWAVKMQVFKQILIYVGAFYGITLTVLFFYSAYAAFVATKRFLLSLNINPRFGDGEVAFEVSLRWGSPRRRDATQNQRSEEVASE
ncbi:hypothetical protein B0J13DRAFT_93480 [Dactylonectria estremocensis]|uniref:Uncharacterized protein n=1 Tax=Dactylonectria estremocensis TaxID=1079267 RepID=A0A9P9E8X7_9HYPO|nr:hypothetical protein B0J13DRAFT_93480 [Dactylonectria estremocensis]